MPVLVMAIVWLVRVLVAWWFLPASTLPVSLVGVSINAANPAQSIAMIRCPGAAGTAMTRPGQAACNLVDVVAVRERAVLVRSVLSSRLEVLTFATAGGAATAPTPASAPVIKTTARGADVTLSKAAVEHYRVNLTEILTAALATPHMATIDGRAVMDGFQLNEIRPGSVIDQVGLKNGDILQRVNGQPLDSLAAAIRLAAAAQTRDESTMDVLRDGKTLTFKITTK